MGNITDRDNTSGKKGFTQNIATTQFSSNIPQPRKRNNIKDDIRKRLPSVLTGGPFLLDKRGRVHGGLARGSAPGKEHLYNTEDN
jgi:hypothetical protein